MATRKEVKATKVVAKKQDKKVDYTGKSQDDLQKLLAEKRQEQLDTKKSHISGELVNPRVLAATRKEVARIMTAINANKESK